MKYNKNEVTGKMRDRIILQNVTRVRSLTGFASESWVDIATIWAFAESKLPGSNETIIDGKNTAKNVCDFTIRYISTITEESRVVWGDKLYQVKNLKVSHDRRFISFTGVFYDSYILTGVNVASSVNGIATTSANLKLIMSVIGQANAIASSFADLTVFQQGTVDVAASVNALGTSTANLTKVVNINSSVDATANISAPLTISKNIQSSVDATATSTGGLQIGKLLSASANANATATSILDVVTQGIVLVDASVTATGTSTANVSRIVTLESSSTTAAETSATAILTKVLEASATASAETNAAAQITIPVNASATATAETSANAQLSYTVNAEATATAETSAEAQIVRIISASATAMAESTAEASFGVTFAANVEGTATVTNATIARAATLAGNVTGQANVTGATLTTVDNVSASVNAAATVTNATLNVAVVDPNFANVSLLLHANGADGSTSFIDNSPSPSTLTGVGNAQLDTALKQFGTASILLDGTGDRITTTSNAKFAFGTGDFTVEGWFYENSRPIYASFIEIGNHLTANGIIFLTRNGITTPARFGIYSGAFFGNDLAPSLNSWNHIAWVRSSGVLKMYVNGVGGTAVSFTNNLTDTATITIGSRSGGNSDYDYNGNIDEIRITKGVARYTGASFTVPTREFPDQ
jgi:SPP1 family predicted phage head-tail adaptor